MWQGAAQWKAMSDGQKAPWKKLASDASKQYAAKKLTMAKAKPAVAKAKAKPGAAKAKLSAGKAKAKPKVAKPRTSKTASKSTRSKVAGTRKSPKLITKTKVCSCTKNVQSSSVLSLKQSSYKIVKIYENLNFIT